MSESIEAAKPPFPSVAVVSGKGGSGKTMIVAAVAAAFDHNDIRATLIDTDVGTGGLSYYLSIKYAQGIGIGLSELLLSKIVAGSTGKSPELTNQILDVRAESISIQRIRRLLRGFKSTCFVSVGDLRKLQARKESDVFRNEIGVCLEEIRRNEPGWMLIDCRGGIDTESLAVCKFVDDIIIIAETDPASFQATQNLANVLSDNDLTDKIRGFIVNRAFDDPSTIARNGTPAFRGQFLGAIPFDLEAIRNFHIGELPSLGSIFSTHALYAFSQAYPELVPPPKGRVWSFRDYRKVGVGDVYSSTGSAVFAALIIGCLLIPTLGEPFFYKYGLYNTNLYEFAFAGAIIGLLSTVGRLRRLMGYLLTRYIEIFSRLLSGSRP